MSGLNYEFVQNMIDFGRTLASDFVGQPFIQYRLNTLSSGNALDAINQIGNLNVKVSATTSRAFIENSYFHTNVFDFKVATASVELGDLFVQNDQVYGQNATYAVASFRPLKPVLAVRVNHLSQLYRLKSNYDPTSNPNGYGGVAIEDELPFVLTNGVYAPASNTPLNDPSIIPSQVPCGIVSTGQLKGLSGQVERLPLDTMRAMWYIYMPELPGLSRLLPGDIVQGPAPDPNENPQRFAIQNAMQIPAGFAGTFYNAELLIP